MTKTNRKSLSASPSPNEHHSLGNLRISAIKNALKKLPDNIRKELHAVIVYGSTASGHATQTSDIDLWIVGPQGKITCDIAKAVLAAVEEAAPNVPITFGSGKIGKTTRSGRVLTTPPPKRPGTQSEWKVVWAGSDEIKKTILNELDLARDFFRKVLHRSC